jgi:prepilin peptidase CpaA
VSAGVYDWRTRKIPNWLNLSGLILGIGLNALVLHGHGLVLALAGLGCSLLVYVPLYLVRGMGAGDVKLMAAIGSIAGPLNWLTIFLAAVILGGIAAFGLVVLKKRLPETLGNLATITGELWHFRLPYLADPALDMRSKRSLGLPHGTVIAVGSLVFLYTGALAL